MPQNPRTPYQKRMAERRSEYERQLEERARVRRLALDDPERIAWQKQAKKRCGGASS